MLDGLPGLAPKGLAAPVYECKPAPSSLISSWEPTHPAQRQHGTRNPSLPPRPAQKGSRNLWDIVMERAPSAAVGMEHAPGGGAGSGGPAQDDARGGGGAPEATGEVRTPGEKQLSSHTRGQFPLH